MSDTATALSQTNQPPAGELSASPNTPRTVTIDDLLPPLPFAEGKRLRPVKVTDIGVLEKLKSPVIAMLREASKPEAERKDFKWSDEELWEMLFLFSKPARAGYTILAAGPNTFRDAALTYVESLPLSMKVWAHRQTILLAMLDHFSKALGEAIATPQENPAQ